MTGVVRTSDALDIFAARLQGRDIPIYVFDFDECMNMEDVLAFMPSAPGRPHHPGHS